MEDFTLVGITLQEALDIAYESDCGADVAEVFIEPPDCHILTDEDSADEDEGGLADNLSSRQLTAGAEIRLTNCRRIGGIQGDLENDSSDVAEIANFENLEEAGSRNIKLANEVPSAKFCDGDLVYTEQYFPKGDYSRYQNMSNTEIFELFFTDELLEIISEQTSKYALYLNCPDPKITLQELRVFLAILLVSGYNELPSKRSYWEASKDMRNDMVYEAMRRDRFLQICRFIHFTDNGNLDLTDKLCKLRPLSDYLKNKFLEHFVPEPNLSYDESMIRYYGRHGCKQFIRGKPIRFGYKVWCLNKPSGYLANFEVYQGKNPRANTTYEQAFGKAAAPLVQMIDDLRNKNKSFRYNIFIDNLFTSPKLLYTLKNNGYNVTGTIRDNRMPKNCPILSKPVMKKQERGACSSSLDKSTGIQYIRWMDNSVVTVASTAFGVEPSRTVERFSRIEKKKVLIPRPHAVLQYNKSMGGTDLMDEGVSNYRIGIRGKKWYWPIFTYLVDVAVYNAWDLSKHTGQTVSQLDFRRTIAKEYLCKFQNLPKSTGKVPKLRTETRYDNIGHWIISIPDNKRRRCAGNNCDSRGRTMCAKCDVGLCVPCFRDYHIRI